YLIVAPITIFTLTSINIIFHPKVKRGYLFYDGNG
ncbi:putative membrane protein, partial [Clostridioides difficile CD129]